MYQFDLYREIIGYQQNDENITFGRNRTLSFQTEIYSKTSPAKPFRNIQIVGTKGQIESWTHRKKRILIAGTREAPLRSAACWDYISGRGEDSSYGALVQPGSVLPDSVWRPASGHHSGTEWRPQMSQSRLVLRALSTLQARELTISKAALNNFQKKASGPQEYK